MLDRRRRLGRPRLAAALVGLAVTAVVAGGPALLGAGAARAASTGADPGLAALAARLRRDQLYQQPGADPALSAGQAAALRRRVRASGLPLFLLVLRPAPTYGAAAAELGRIAERTAVAGIYAALSGRYLVAGDLGGVFPAAATLARLIVARDHGRRPDAVLNDYVTAVVAAVAGSAGAGPRAGGGTNPLPWVLVGVGVLAAASVAFVAVARRRRTGGWRATGGPARRRPPVAGGPAPADAAAGAAPEDPAAGGDAVREADDGAEIDPAATAGWDEPAGGFAGEWGDDLADPVTRRPPPSASGPPR